MITDPEAITTFLMLASAAIAGDDGDDEPRPERRHKKKKKKTPFPFKVKDTDVTTKATSAKSSKGPERRALQSKRGAVGKREHAERAIERVRASVPKISGGGMSHVATGAGMFTNFRVNGKMILSNVTWNETMCLNKKDGLTVDGNTLYTFKKGDSWSIGSMTATSVTI